MLKKLKKICAICLIITLIAGIASSAFGISVLAANNKKTTPTTMPIQLNFSEEEKKKPKNQLKCEGSNTRQYP